MPVFRMRKKARILFLTPVSGQDFLVGILPDLCGERVGL